MATEPKTVSEDAKIDLFEDDDEFEEFEINEGIPRFPLSFISRVRYLSQLREKFYYSTLADFIVFAH